MPGYFMKKENLLFGMIAGLMMLSIGFLSLHGVNFQVRDCKELHDLMRGVGATKPSISYQIRNLPFRGFLVDPAAQSGN